MLTRSLILVLQVSILVACTKPDDPGSWIRINLLGYKPQGIKVAVWCGKGTQEVSTFQLVDATTQKLVFESDASDAFGPYGPFTQTYRLDFSSFVETGNYYLRAGNASSPVFEIGEHVYRAAADFSLQYMRQQRSGYNPYLKDSCHTADGYTVYGPMPDSTHIDVAGGWHDATDYLQYAMTSANATYHLLAAYRDFPDVFVDEHLANGLPGNNGVADVLDEARWGLDWLVKMHPRPDWMFNQLADDRDHIGFRLPVKDTADYGKGFERPVYFLTGEVQGLGQYKNRTTGTASTAAKFSSAFALGFQLFEHKDATYAHLLRNKSASAYRFALRKPGNTQTACYTAPYFYEEDNWVDDMELAATQQFVVFRDSVLMRAAFEYGEQEKQTPWLGKDTASHYQWYPFVNIGHYELAKVASGPMRAELNEFYRSGIEAVWQRAKGNAFYRGVPYIWCSNNLQTAFAVQCFWYRETSGDDTYASMEQSAFDWLLGCNPWGTSMIVGLPADGDFPDDPHSSLNVLYGYQTLGGLVDGPVYGSIYKQQRGVSVVHGDEYDEFQSETVVYHDDYGDYVTNEPTMDGTANLIYLLAAEASGSSTGLTYDHGAVVRGKKSSRQVALVFTGDSYGDGGPFIARTLRERKVPASFFFTGNFYRNPEFSAMIQILRDDGHYLGPHSDRHLLYCSWSDRDSLLVTRQQFLDDLDANYDVMNAFGISKAKAPYFIPPYEWYNDSIASWTRLAGLQLVNYTPGTLSHADYTTPGLPKYRSSEEIMASIRHMRSDLGGFMLLMHVGTDPIRTDKFYSMLPDLIEMLRVEGYTLVSVPDLLQRL
jgi:peptidoglycan/xylan/chitin deacetylase (PgdA/CDA1 family)